MHIAETDSPCAHVLHPRKPFVRVYLDCKNRVSNGLQLETAIVRVWHTPNFTLMNIWTDGDSMIMIVPDVA